jgi:glycerol-3-phosphate acyltransferase PlsY
MHVSDAIQIAILGWALGGIPFGVLLAKLFRLPDPRYIGSGNIGATNMLRTGRKDVALLTLLLDAGKGAVAVVLAKLLFAPPAPTGCLVHTAWTPEMERACAELSTVHPWLGAIALLFAAIGHMYTPWLKFKGGKGVATILGAALAFAWPVGMATIVIWIIIFYTTRYVSVASILSLALMPLIAWLRVDGISALIIAAAVAIAIWRHRENISRLRKGFEHRFSFGKGGEK